MVSRFPSVAEVMMAINNSPGNDHKLGAFTIATGEELAGKKLVSLTLAGPLTRTAEIGRFYLEDEPGPWREPVPLSSDIAPILTEEPVSSFESKAAKFLVLDRPISCPLDKVCEGG